MLVAVSTAPGVLTLSRGFVRNVLLAAAVLEPVPTDNKNAAATRHGHPFCWIIWKELELCVVATDAVQLLVVELRTDAPVSTKQVLALDRSIAIRSGAGLDPNEVELDFIEGTIDGVPCASDTALRNTVERWLVDVEIPVHGQIAVSVTPARLLNVVRIATALAADSVEFESLGDRRPLLVALRQDGIRARVLTAQSVDRENG